MKLLYILLLFTLVPSALLSRTLEVRAGGAYTNLEAAARDAVPGDTILFRAGVYAGGESVSGLQGTAAAPIIIMAEPDQVVTLRGGSNAWQLSDVAHLRIVGFTLDGQTGNGLNIDDAGTLETPTHHLVIERCTWNGIDATGNNDLLKLSGVDSFEVRDCTFRDGAAGGSMVDMVGCHNGLFIGNLFERAGSNAIQAKGGTQYIRIERNTFLNGGQRAVNIGGSTGLQFFRPQGANFESANIYVYSNFFAGGVTPFAFVGTVHSKVVNNTVYVPERWALRILQETTESNFLQCGDNIVRNNIIVVGNGGANPTVNVGPNTRPETFTFSNNLWYNRDNPNWTGPSLPAQETGGVVGNPQLGDPPSNIVPGPTSPARGAGMAVNEPVLDYLGQPFGTPRSIGAVQAGGSVTSVDHVAGRTFSVTLLGAGRGASAVMILDMPKSDVVEIALYDLLGNVLWSARDIRAAGPSMLRLPTEGYAAGRYFCAVRSGGVQVVRSMILGE